MTHTLTHAYICLLSRRDRFNWALGREGMRVAGSRMFEGCSMAITSIDGLATLERWF